MLSNGKNSQDVASCFKFKLGYGNSFFALFYNRDPSIMGIPSLIGILVLE